MTVSVQGRAGCLDRGNPDKGWQIVAIIGTVTTIEPVEGPVELIVVSDFI